LFSGANEVDFKMNKTLLRFAKLTFFLIRGVKENLGKGKPWLIAYGWNSLQNSKYPQSDPDWNVAPLYEGGGGL
jgi:hypothetical protein